MADADLVHFCSICLCAAAIAVIALGISSHRECVVQVTKRNGRGGRGGKGGEQEGGEAHLVASLCVCVGQPMKKKKKKRRKEQTGDKQAREGE